MHGFSHSVHVSNSLIWGLRFECVFDVTATRLKIDYWRVFFDCHSSYQLLPKEMVLVDESPWPASLRQVSKQFGFCRKVRFLNWVPLNELHEEMWLGCCCFRWEMSKRRGLWFIRLSIFDEASGTFSEKPFLELKRSNEWRDRKTTI